MANGGSKRSFELMKMKTQHSRRWGMAKGELRKYILVNINLYFKNVK